MHDPFKSHEITRLIFDSLSRMAVTVITDADDRIVAISDHYVKILKRNRENIIGQPVSKIIPNTNMPMIRKNGQPDCKLFTLANGETVIAHYVPLIKDKKTRGVFAYTSMNTIEYMSTLSTMDIVRRLNDELNQFKNELQKLRGAKYSLNNIIGSSAEMVETKELARKVAQTKSTVLITGETGTGKELFAHAIHQASTRSHQSFIALNCAAIPASLFESELFGHEKGSFTGATATMKGKFEQADGGTLFLDEISAMPLELQPKLLRILEERCFSRIGSSEEHHVDVRLIAASNKDLQEAVKRGEFRDDLYHRLNVIPVSMPSLRERREDIPILAKTFLAELSGGTKNFEDESLQYLSGLEWRGNVRELRNAVERISIFVASSSIKTVHVREVGIGDATASSADTRALLLSLLRSNDKQTNLLDGLEKDLIDLALREANGNATEAARILGVHRNALLRRIEKYGLR
jgi:transcriptional regulator with PAS, ATPase and Fis domain